MSTVQPPAILEPMMRINPPVNDQMSRIETLLPFPDSNVGSDDDRMEVIHGPASILYGSNKMVAHGIALSA
jgi:hypothetical protein